MLNANLFLMTLDLQLFAEGGSGDGGTGSAGETGATGTAAVSQTSITDADGTTATNIDREAEFEKLIKFCLSINIGSSSTIRIGY